MIPLLNDYFTAFSNKDLDRLSELFHDSVTLRDWNLPLTRGKDAVLRANQNIFDSVENIHIQQLALYECSYNAGSYAVNILIDIVDKDNEKTMIKVIDLIDIVDGKITRIEAYKL